MNATDKTYNGWTNYETWAVKLWMDNEEGTYNYWQDVTRDILRRSVARTYLTEREAAAIELADLLKAEHEEAAPEVSGVFADLLSAALSEVDWHEIASSLIGDIEE
jgi:hypothetical protein